MALCRDLFNRSLVPDEAAYIVVVHRAGAKLVVRKLMQSFTTLKITFVDDGYTGDKLKKWFKEVENIILQIVKRPRKMFQIVKFLWIVERVFG